MNDPSLPLAPAVAARTVKPVVFAVRVVGAKAAVFGETPVPVALVVRVAVRV